MHRRIEGTGWMEPETKQEALAKLDAVRLVVCRDDLFGNVQRVGEALRRAQFDGLGQPLSTDDGFDPATWMGGSYETSADEWAAPMVRGIVPNQPDFREALGCRAGQAIVKPPEPICSVG